MKPLDLVQVTGKQALPSRGGGGQEGKGGGTGAGGRGEMISHLSLGVAPPPSHCIHPLSPPPRHLLSYLHGDTGRRSTVNVKFSIFFLICFPSDQSYELMPPGIWQDNVNKVGKIYNVEIRNSPLFVNLSSSEKGLCCRGGCRILEREIQPLGLHAKGS